MCVCVRVYEHITHIAAGLDCFYSQVLVCRSHSKRGNEAEIKRKKPTGPADKERPWQRRRERKGFDVACPVGVHPLFLPSPFLPPLSPSLSTPCLVPPPPLQFSPLSSSLLIVWASWCLSGPSLYVSIKRSIYLIIALTTAY